MNLYEFKKSVDFHLTKAPQEEQWVIEKELLDEIRSYFPPAESSKSLTVIRNLIHELAVRRLCDNQPLQPYRNVAQALQLALRTHGTSAGAEVDWEAAMRTAVCYRRPPNLSSTTL